jgi:TP901 family phage tail tape measure protein
MANREKTDFGIGMLFSVGVSGERSLYALSSLMNAVKASAIAASIELGVLTRAAAVFAVGLGVTILGIKAFKAALNMADEAAEFDYQLRHIAALGASFGEDMSGYGDDILDLSMKYGIAAIDIAQASKELLRAGLSPSESTAMLDPILQMSLIGEMSASDAASTMLAVVNSMKYSATDAAAIMDTLTYSANAGWIEVEDFWQGFARFGAQSLAMNQPLE